MFGAFTPSALQLRQNQRSLSSQSTDRISPQAAQTVITTGTALFPIGSSSSEG